MALKYISDKRTIILCVIPANIDITTSEALKMAGEVDTSGVRTIGVITKIDIMDKGTNAKKTLLGQEVQLKLGYVGVKLRSQQDIIDKKNVQIALEDERQYFAKHPVYSAMGPGYVGTQTLSNKLTRILYTHIKFNLPDIIREISERIQDVSDRLKDLGPPLPEEPSEKLQMAWIMIMEFCQMFKDAISGKPLTHKDRKEKAHDFQGGAKIKIQYYKLFEQYSKPDFKITDAENYDDDMIQNSILLHEGDSMPGFPSADVFVSLIQPQIEKLKSPAMDLLADVYIYLEDLANKLKEKAFKRFPMFGEELMEKITEVMQTERERARYLVESILDSEHEYMFTNDAEYLMNRTDIVPEVKDKSEEKKSDSAVMAGAQPNAQPGAPAASVAHTEPIKAKKDKNPGKSQSKKTTKIFVRELRTRLDTYFRIVVRNIRDSIPKVIGFFLVRAVQEKMQLELFKKMSEMHEVINRNLGEPASVVKERKGLTAQLDVLRKAERVLSRDPEITNAIGAVDEELLHQLRAEKPDDQKGGKKTSLEKFKESVDEDKKRKEQEMIKRKIEEDEEKKIQEKARQLAAPPPAVHEEKKEPVSVQPVAEHAKPPVADPVHQGRVPSPVNKAPIASSGNAPPAHMLATHSGAPVHSAGLAPSPQNVVKPVPVQYGQPRPPSYAAPAVPQNPSPVHGKVNGELPKSGGVSPGKAPTPPFSNFPPAAKHEEKKTGNLFGATSSSKKA